jgi:hypothetical protein
MFQAIGFFNEVDTLVSSSILIYSDSTTGLYTQLGCQDAALIKIVIKLVSLINRECLLIKFAKRA